jgi:hypothetical protein
MATTLILGYSQFMFSIFSHRISRCLGTSWSNVRAKCSEVCSFQSHDRVAGDKRESSTEVQRS